MSPLPDEHPSLSVSTSKSAGSTAPDPHTLRALTNPSRAPHTIRGYLADWTAFRAWCAERGHDPLPATPETVAAHLTFMAALADADGHPRYATGTIARRKSAIDTVHRAEGHAPPGAHTVVRDAVTVARARKTREAHRSHSINATDLLAIVESIDQRSWPTGVVGHRDAAILTMGWAGAFRPSELAALRIADIHRHPDGLNIPLYRTSDPHTQRTYLKTLPFNDAHPAICAPCAFGRWIRVLAAAIAGRAQLMKAIRETRTEEHQCRAPLPEIAALDPTAPLLRAVTKHGAIGHSHVTAQAITFAVKRRAAMIGADTATYAARSLRAGYIVHAISAGTPLRQIVDQTGHASIAGPARYLSPDAEPIPNAVRRLGL